MEKQPSNWTKQTFGLGLFEWRLLHISVGDGETDTALLQIVAHNTQEALHILGSYFLKGWGQEQSLEEYEHTYGEAKDFYELLPEGDKRDFQTIELAEQYDYITYKGPREHPFIAHLDIFDHIEVTDKTIEWPDGFKWNGQSDRPEDPPGIEDHEE